MRLLQRLPRETGRDYALRSIKENIISLDLAPGSSISENELASELGLSRTPVREALIELAKVKIITVAPQKKSLVAPIDYDLVEESRFARKVLECAVAELACTIATGEEEALLEENVCLQTFYLEHFDPLQLLSLDDQFHRLLFRIARKEQVYQLINTISIHFDRVRSMALSSVKDIKIVQDHAQIARAVRQRDPAAARSLMEKHLDRYRVDAAAIRERYPQYFSD